MCVDGFYGLGFGWLWMILFWGAVIAFIVWAVSNLAGRDKRVSTSNYVNIVRERYAKGEIRKEEFEQIKKDLSEDKQ
jgi:putative membrane protein